MNPRVPAGIALGAVFDILWLFGIIPYVLAPRIHPDPLIGVSLAVMGAATLGLPLAVIRPKESKKSSATATNYQALKDLELKDRMRSSPRVEEDAPPTPSEPTAPAGPVEPQPQSEELLLNVVVTQVIKRHGTVKVKDFQETSRETVSSKMQEVE